MFSHQECVIKIEEEGSLPDNIKHPQRMRNSSKNQGKVISKMNFL